jgi:ribulose 1,5-bisphosphate synthetase/thiazole synthase
MRTLLSNTGKSRPAIKRQPRGNEGKMAEYDVVVVGAGNAAMCAALAAREQGVSVLVLERGARRARRQLGLHRGRDPHRL